MNREVRHVCVTHTTCVFDEIPILYKDVNIQCILCNRTVKSMTVIRGHKS